MRAALVDPIERRLVLGDVDPPTPGPAQLLVAVRAAGLNRADLAVIAGTYHLGGAGAVRRRRRARRRGRGGG